MRFDVNKARAELGPEAAPIAAPALPPIVAKVAFVAAPQALKPNPTPPSAGPEAVPLDAFRHGRDINGNPKTWEGRIVTLAIWRGLSEWEKHGSTGQVWNGPSRQWELLQDDEGKNHE